MTHDEVQSALDATERALDAEGPVDLRSTGFWRAVGAIKRDSDHVEAFADRVGRLDRALFERWASFTIPFGLGTTLAVAGTVVGLVVIAAAYYVDDPWNGLLLLAGLGIVLVPTHGLGHLVAGARSGMRFTHWFVGTMRRPQPGVKIDYATYLRTPAMARAWMHASGALVTKAIPFVLLGAAWGMEAPGWAWAVLLVVGIGQVATDVLWSTKSSDWKKFARERRYA